MNIVVETLSENGTFATLRAGGKQYPCVLGRTGVTRNKAEGDGKTPIGTFPLRQLLYRADRLEKPQTGLPVEVLTPDTGWCEDPADPEYNKKVTLPRAGAIDNMTRDDHLYDLCIVVGYNDAPPVAGKGSAIFIHLARGEGKPTAGCIGLNKKDLLEVLKLLHDKSSITIMPPPGY